MLHYELWGGGGVRATAAKHNNATRPTNAAASNAATTDATAAAAAAANNAATANAATVNATTAAVCTTVTSDWQRARTVLVLKR